MNSSFSFEQLSSKVLELDPNFDLDYLHNIYENIEDEISFDNFMTYFIDAYLTNQLED